MGYLDTWNVLEEMIADFRRRRQSVPTRIMNDLKSAKTMIRILRADVNCGEAAQKIDGYLGSVESYLVSEGEKTFGAAYAEEWLERLGEAGRRPTREEEATRFVSGLPREHSWIRVRPSDELSIERLETLAEVSSLSFRIQDDGSLLVFGREDRVRNFVKKMTTEYGLKTGK